MTNVVSLSPYITEREEQDRIDAAQIAAGWYFDDATKAQHEAYKAATSTAEKLFGHGSEAHCAVIDLAQRQWDRDTAEARELYDRSVERLIATGEIGDELDDAWTELAQRETVRTLMHAAE